MALHSLIPQSEATTLKRISNFKMSKVIVITRIAMNSVATVGKYEEVCSV